MIVCNIGEMDGYFCAISAVYIAMGGLGWDIIDKNKNEAAPHEHI